MTHPAEPRLSFFSRQRRHDVTRAPILRSARIARDVDPLARRARARRPRRRSPRDAARVRRRLFALLGTQEPPAAKTFKVARRLLADVGGFERRADVPSRPAAVRASQPGLRLRAARALRDDDERARVDPRVRAPRPCGGAPRLALPLPRAELPQVRRTRRRERRKDLSVRALTQKLSRTRALLDAIQDLAEQQATHEQRSDSRMTSLEEKVARYREALRKRRRRRHWRNRRGTAGTTSRRSTTSCRTRRGPAASSGTHPPQAQLGGQAQGSRRLGVWLFRRRRRRRRRGRDADATC